MRGRWGERARDSDRDTGRYRSRSIQVENGHLLAAATRQEQRLTSARRMLGAAFQFYGNLRPGFDFNSFGPRFTLQIVIVI